MNELVLDDTSVRQDFFPFTLSRSVADIRLGILTIREKWEFLLAQTKKIKTNPNQFRSSFPANLIPDQSLVMAIDRGEDDPLVASNGKPLRFILHPGDIFLENDAHIRQDFELITHNRISQPIPASNRTMGSESIFLEPGARVEHAILNATTGPIYVGKNAQIMEGVMIRGPVSIGESAVVKMGTVIYGASTIGPECIVGGEIKNSVLFGYSNKAHHGYLGDSVIGEWCNLGAGSSNSNVKNTGGKVRVWNDAKKAFFEGGAKCGLFMGDYCRAAINTSFTTGTVVGVCCNIFGLGLTPNYLPSFSWGFSPPQKYRLNKAIEDITNWKKFKNQQLTPLEIRTLTHIFEQSQST
jgi:UDP-N-acetylglucosamine diphosphorylase / glucose-1-phosphate thymidylyltransferase / UDP-N-acetylgalactosamine diphosphorylase / glucosamine-1-phosphate N-acetyltransferase / galactosamine-1-phosphate N-acetyltransferase